jgi:REP element-mobilizing transposase RayT
MPITFITVDTKKQTIFFAEKNYLFFLQKVRYEWLPYAEVLSYCLMPNHFHFIIVPNEEGCRNMVLKERETYAGVIKCHWQNAELIYAGDQHRTIPNRKSFSKENKSKMPDGSKQANYI